MKGNELIEMNNFLCSLSCTCMTMRDCLFYASGSLSLDVPLGYIAKLLLEWLNIYGKLRSFRFVVGLLKDIYGTYDGAFYFGGAAIFAGALIMAGGNIRKIYLDRQEKRSAVEKDVHDKNV